jgi:hypothetical protein
MPTFVRLNILMTRKMHITVQSINHISFRQDILYEILFIVQGIIYYCYCNSCIFIILTRPAFFPIEHRRTESVCFYATESQFDILYLNM